MKSAPQTPRCRLERATWQGEAVVAVVAQTRAAPRMVSRRCWWSSTAACADGHGDGARSGTVVIHPELGDNLVFTRTAEAGDVAAAFAGAHKVVEATFHTGRHTGVTLEPRSIIADYNRADHTLTVHHSPRHRT